MMMNVGHVGTAGCVTSGVSQYRQNYNNACLDHSERCILYEQLFCYLSFVLVVMLD